MFYYSNLHVAVKRISKKYVEIYLAPWLSELTEKIDFFVFPPEPVDAGQLIAKIVVRKNDTAVSFDIISPISGTIVEIYENSKGKIAVMKSQDDIENILFSEEEYKEYLETISDPFEVF